MIYYQKDVSFEYENEFQVKKMTKDKIEVSEKTKKLGLPTTWEEVYEMPEFADEDPQIQVGDVVDVFIERLENKKGELLISRASAKKYKCWNFLKECLAKNIKIQHNQNLM